MTQLSLLDYEAPKPRFQGSTVTESDAPRLGKQLIAVRDYALSREWVCLHQIHKDLGIPEASASARLRDLRKQGYSVERQRVPDGHGLHRYKITKGASNGTNG